jgi:hypothetical protein
MHAVTPGCRAPILNMKNYVLIPQSKIKRAPLRPPERTLNLCESRYKY